MLQYKKKQKGAKYNQIQNRGCTGTEMDTGTGTIWWHEKFLKNYNMIQQIGHHYDTGTAPQNEVFVLPSPKLT